MPHVLSCIHTDLQVVQSAGASLLLSLQGLKAFAVRDRACEKRIFRHLASGGGRSVIVESGRLIEEEDVISMPHSKEGNASKTSDNRLVTQDPEGICLPTHRPCSPPHSPVRPQFV